ALPADARGHVIVEVAGPGDELPLTVPAGVTLQWLHRGASSHETDLVGERSPMVAAVRALDADGWPAGRVQVFVHGEGDAVMHQIRPLLKKNGVARGDLSVSAYWRRGRTEEGFRVWKQDLAKAEADA
ncbi:MAG TPA: siderophore-interacting protein, partial [Nocardioides sp.]